MITFESLIVYAFSIANVCRLIAYLPQIALLIRESGPASGTSGLAWALFLVAHGATALYAAVVLKDAGMAIVFAANVVGCGAIVVLVCLRRQQWRRTAGCVAR